jgi:hypothetical protein
MKAVINEKETPVEKRKYPYLGKADKKVEEQFVVLFTSYKTGVVVQTNDKTYWPLGHTDIRWAEYDCFTPFTGSITLSND